MADGAPHIHKPTISYPHRSDGSWNWCVTYGDTTMWTPKQKTRVLEPSFVIETLKRAIIQHDEGSKAYRTEEVAREEIEQMFAQFYNFLPREGRWAMDVLEEYKDVELPTSRLGIPAAVLPHTHSGPEGLSVPTIEVPTEQMKRSWHLPSIRSR